ncbi:MULTISPECIES: TetR/AcrR family transcriptional regulator [unclassified Caballeronia]|uniref:TetR/AcrR family transcriptional regulator n=1 Tax=unclassified Caballeronia TaxID=2646786 RepID=UPI0028555E97|nr:MULTISPECIES: TetR/AcrR family transcriptional regulator [unclassified Caballeronia]MDR5812376.1 TetR/AcrR family transcriptional regulator [Caballeronia sp. LZ033]MDR5819202.1 TetR/AcrR family transcriptional regulator [Caballeronia sp. LZ043]MDR5876997.1 TetR/AcrR family transcriptional regulator [Caballeronia sp. LZ032]
MDKSTVREALLEHAQTLLMTRGYNAFSYRDLAELVGVKTSSIHYYFPAKEDLALEAVNAYSADLMSSVYAIDSSAPADKKLDRYAKVFGRILGGGNQVCLCGMLAADIESLPDKVRQAVQAYFKANENWLAKVLAEGEAQDTLDAGGKPEAAARTLYAAFQGGLLASRLFQVRARLEEIADSVRR